MFTLGPSGPVLKDLAEDDITAAMLLKAAD
jgi:hypothetical protein